VYHINILSMYREAEVRGAELLQRLLRNCDDPSMVIRLTGQLADETRHIQLLTDLLAEFGGIPRVIRKKALPPRCSNGSSTITLETLAYLYATEALLQQRYREHAAQSGEDSRIVNTLQALVADEEWHLIGVKALLATQAQKFGRTRVVAMLDYYWDLARKA
jgi:hypothetical protein